MHRLVGLSDSTQYLCSHPSENALHYITQCWLYTEERQNLFNKMKQYIPNFPNITKKRQFEILLYGYEPRNPEMTKINTKILRLTQNYIYATKRF